MTKSHLIITLIVLQLILFAYGLPRELDYVHDSQRAEKMYVATATYINAHYPSNSRLCITDAGIIPFYTHMVSMDFNGLMDSNLTMYEYEFKDWSTLQYRTERIAEHRINYFFDWNPDVFVLGAGDSVIPQWYIDRLLFSDPRMKYYYGPVERISYEREYYGHGERTQYSEFIFERIKN